MDARVPISAMSWSRSRTGDRAFASGRAELSALGPTLAENGGQFSGYGQRGIKLAQMPLTATGGMAGLKGKRAPIGAVKSVAGTLVSEFREPMWCSAHEEAFVEAMSCEFESGTLSGKATETHYDAVY